MKWLLEELKKDRYFLILVVAGVSFFIFKLFHISYQSLWMDDGFHVLAVQKILKHGYPLYPSGHIYFKSIFYTYCLSGVSVFLGSGVWAFRLFSLVIHMVAPWTVYRLGKNLLSRQILLVSGVLLYLGTWETEYARSVLYYSLLQFLFTISIFLFFRNRVLEEKRRFALPWIVTGLTHQLGMGLAFSFPALLIQYPRRFFRKKNLLSLIFWVPFFLFLMLQEVLLWDVGQVYSNQGVISTGSILQYFFKSFRGVYVNLMGLSHPNTFPLFLIGGILLGGFLIWKRFFQKKETAVFENLLMFLSLTFFFILLGLGLMRTHPMPRYLFPFHHVYLIIVVSFLYIPLNYLWQQIKVKRLQWAAVLLLFALSYGLLTPVGLFKVRDIVFREYNEPVNTDTVYTSGRPFPVDHESLGYHVRSKLKDGDVVIAIHMIFQYIYAGRVDYWLFTGGVGTWDAWEEVNGKWQDVYLGVPWINSLKKLRDVIGETISAGNRVWIITSNSEAKKGHISRDIQAFLKNNLPRVQWVSRDGIGKVYLFDSVPIPDKEYVYRGEWGLVKSKKRVRIDGHGFVQLDRNSVYKTAMIFPGNTSRKVFFRFMSRDLETTVEMKVLYNGRVQYRKLFNVRQETILQQIPFPQKGKHSLSLSVLKGPPVFLEYLKIQNEE